jgi:hypothetical protein
MGVRGGVQALARVRLDLGEANSHPALRPIGHDPAPEQRGRHDVDRPEQVVRGEERTRLEPVVVGQR